MNKKKIIIISLISIFIIVLSIILISILFKSKSNNETNNDINNVENIDISIDTDNDDEKIEWDKYEVKNIELTETYSINGEGIYNLTGTITDGQIIVNTKGNVKLVLDNVSITNSNGPAIYVIKANNVVIELKEGSTNYLEDGTTYSKDYDSDSGVILSKDDLTLEGTGKLIIKANYEDGIVSKDDLKIINGNYEITSKDDGIRGKDSVYILDGNFNITSGGDGIKSTNSEETGKGFILIENGNYIINSNSDAIQAETKLVIKDGTYNIKTTTTSIKNNTAKGLKSSDNLVIENGTFTFNTADDSIHSNNYVGINNGTITIISNDDGIHADEELIIDNATITIEKSYEGLEASNVVINGGTISINASDDGINVAGGADQSSMEERPGRNNFSTNSNNKLTINGGTIYVNSNGDGLDANGSIYVNGGNITVDGPTNDGNGALDYDKEFVVTDGIILAGGSSGMAQNISNNSSIYGVLIGFTSTYGSGDIITITDSSNNIIATYSQDKSYTSLVVVTPKFEKGKTYSVLVNDTKYKDFTISSISTTVGSINSGPGGMGGPNSMPNDRRR